MTDHKYTDEEVIRALDICDKLDFFGGQRAGRELWFTKPVEVQNADIMKFAEDIAFVKEIINRQRAEIEKWQLAYDCADSALRELSVTRSEAIKEFAERLKVYKQKPEFPWDEWFVTETDIDELVKIMTEGEK